MKTGSSSFSLLLFLLLLFAASTTLKAKSEKEGSPTKPHQVRQNISDFEPLITNLGPAVTQISTLRGHLADNEHYIFSRNTIPGELLGYDVDENEITLQVSITLDGDRSTGSSAMHHIDDQLYIAANFENRRLSLLRLDRNTGEYDEVASLHPARDAMDMAVSPDGKIYVSTTHQFNASVYEYDIKSGTGRWIGSFQTQGRQQASSVAATLNHVYAGISLEAPDLWRYNRDTEEKESIFPDELRPGWLDVNAIALHDEWIVAGGRVSSSIVPGVVMVNRNDPSIYKTVNHDHHLVQSIAVEGNMIYFGSGEGVWAYNIATDEVNRLSGLSCNRGLFYRNGVLHGTNGRRNVGMYDLDTEVLTVVDLAKDAGAREWAEPGQCLLYSDGKVYVGGHHTIGIHNINEKTFRTLPMSGEAKHMISVPAERPGDTNLIYWGGYGSGNIYRYDPDSGQIEIMASAPPGNNRPRALAYDAVNGFILMGTQADRNGAGALTVFNPETEESFYFDMPFIDHSVSAVTALDGIVYLGSAQGTIDPDTDARVIAWNPVEKKQLWKITPVADNQRIRSLITTNGVIMGMTVNGFLFVLDPDDGSVLHTKQIFPGHSDHLPGRLIAKKNRIIAVSENEIRSIDPENYDDEMLITGLKSHWFHWPDADIDDNGAIYALHQQNLIRISHDQLKPALLHPAFFSTVDVQPEFRWQDIPGVEKYQFQLTATNFDNLLLDTLVHGSSFTYPAKLDHSRSCRWRVRGMVNMEIPWADPFLFFTKEHPSAITEDHPAPTRFDLKHNHPNPFNPSTKIPYTIPETSHVTLEVYDITGKKVATLVNDIKNAGYHQVIFDASCLSSGLYIYRLKAGGKVFTRKMTLMK